MISSTMRRRSMCARSLVFSKRLKSVSTARWSSFRSEMASMGPQSHHDGHPCARSARGDLVAQLPLEDLARRVARQLVVEEDHLARHLERRQALPHVALQLLPGERGARSQVDGGGHL